MDLWNESCPCVQTPGRPSWVAKTLALIFTCKLYNHFFFHSSHAYKHYWLLPYYTTFTDLDLTLVHKVNAKQNLLASFSRTLFNCWNLTMVLKQFLLNILMLLFIGISWKRGITAVLLFSCFVPLWRFYSECTCVRVRARECVGACVRACLRASVCVFVCLRVPVSASVYLCMWLCICMCLHCLHFVRRSPNVSMYTFVFEDIGLITWGAFSPTTSLT